MHNDIMAAGSRERPPMLALALGYEPGQPCRVQEETYANTTPENQRLIDAEAEAIYMILNGIGDDIYSTVDACSNANEMWLAIKHLQQGDSINKQDVKTKLFWEFGECSVSKTTSTRIVKQHQNEVNKIHVEKIARNAKPLALVAATQHYQDTYSLDTNYQAPKPHRTHTSSSIHTTSASSHATTQNKVKEIAKPITPLSKSAYEEDSVPLSAEQDEWLHDIDDKLDEQELEAHFIQYSEQLESINDTYVVEMVDSIVTPGSSDICDNERTTDQNAEEHKDERVLLASLIANFKFDVDEYKKYQKQLKKENTSLTQELEKSKQDLEKSKQDLSFCKSELEKYKIFQTNHKDKEKAELECEKAY
ncbi:hypothetical protein Tco_0803765 [Tanacetum coccineum]|uniref:Gag-Pol polyprotein n=1 Tax=Tanacetum coccineum TaxID=301880 RepID=A0ABQ5A3G9_9ASTR